MKGLCVAALLLSAPCALGVRRRSDKVEFGTESVCPAIKEPSPPPAKEQCKGHGVIRDFKIEDVLPANLPAGEEPPVEIATHDNACMHPEVDFTGIWWMSSDKSLTWKGQMGGNKLDEYLVSFAGAVVNSTTDFPAAMTSPTNYARHWTWGKAESGKFLMNWYAQKNEVTDHQHMVFHNSTLAEFQPVAAILKSSKMYLATKKSEDEWVRLNYSPMEGQTLEDAEYIYTLVRIIHADGTPTRFWDMFLKYMHDRDNFANPFWGKTHMYAWNSDDKCMRKCEAGYTTRILPCSVCAWKCR